MPPWKLAQALEHLRMLGLDAEAARIEAWRNRLGQMGGWDGFAKRIGLRPILWP